jgi:hypothetical protein
MPKKIHAKNGKLDIAKSKVHLNCLPEKMKMNFFSPQQGADALILCGLLTPKDQW